MGILAIKAVLVDDGVGFLICPGKVIDEEGSVELAVSGVLMEFGTAVFD